MNEQDLEQISLFIDGEMAPHEATEFRQRLLAESGLRAEFERVKAVNARVGEAFAGAELEAVPPHVAQALAGPRTASRAPGNVMAWQRGAIAASVVAATVLLITPQWREQGGQDMPGATFASVLETAASRADGWETLADGSEIRPLLSFRNHDGAYCREFLLSAAEKAQRGVACRVEGYWRTEVLVAAVMPEAAGEYRPASSADVDEIASYVNKHADGEVLSLPEESHVISRKWQ